MSNNTADIALFQISLKALIIKDQKVLTLISKDNFFDFPGGRINTNEVKLAFNTSLNRELNEELSKDFRFKIKQFAFASKRVFQKEKIDQPVIALFFNVTALNESINLSDEHQDYKWLKISELLAYPEKFVSVDEFNQLKNYLIISKKTYNN